MEPWANVTGKTTYSCSFNEPGYYVYRLYAVNSAGTPATEWKSFVVYDKEPSDLSVQCDKSYYAVGETINFNFSVNNAVESYILIDANGVRVEPWANVTGKTTYSCSFNEPGYYVYRLYAVNAYATPATEWKVFYIYERGDINLDGECNISDIVLLQKWLLSIPSTELKCWQAADLYKNEKLDGFDLAFLKHLLLASE